MTKDELKLELDALGVEYPKDAKLADLEALYAPYAPPADTGEAPEPDGPEEQPQAVQGDSEQPQPDAIDADRAVVSAAHGLNLRSEQNGNVIHVLPRGAECDVLERDGEWCRVSYEVDGWVRSEFLAGAEVAKDE